jgi:predicted phage gp36 major capsid-like protein
MKYVMTWWERPGGAHADHEAAQKRVLDLFQNWYVPETLEVHQFVVRVGEFGGYAVVETDDMAAVEKLTTIFATFRFRLEPVMDVVDAVAAQTEGIAWREANAPTSSAAPRGPIHPTS